MVGGSVTCRAIVMMGLSMIAGPLTVERFAWVHSQGENWALGGVHGPHLIGEYDSVEGWDPNGLSVVVELDDDRKAELAEWLGVTVEPDDEYVHDVVFRAVDAARAG